MRVIAGSLGGRTFASPHSQHTHPMSDKIRGALFNALGELDGLTVLDAFAGTGALSFEAVSRGATSVIAIENDRIAQRTITENIQTLGVSSQVKLINTTAQIWQQANSDAQFDVVLLDPPYDNLQLSTIQGLVERTAADGIAVLSWPGGEPLPDFASFSCIAHKTYGDAQLGFYRRG